MAATKDQFFKPAKQSSSAKAAATESASRLIIDAEANMRDKKTERLKALRMARDAVMVPAEPVKAKSRAKKKA